MAIQFRWLFEFNILRPSKEIFPTHTITYIIILDYKKKKNVWFRMPCIVFEHDRVVPSTKKNFRARDVVEYFKIFLSAGNNPGVL